MNVLLDNNPWQINTKPLQHQICAKEKFRNSIVTTPSCPGDKKTFAIEKFQNLIETTRSCPEDKKPLIKMNSKLAFQDYELQLFFLLH